VFLSGQFVVGIAALSLHLDRVVLVLITIDNMREFGHNNYLYNPSNIGEGPQYICIVLNNRIPRCSEPK
jgi:hypothetical protein